MAKVKFTKTELKHQQDARRQFVRFLPTLQLKKQQLQFEVRQSADLLLQNRTRQQQLEKGINDYIALYGSKSRINLLKSCVKIKAVRQGSGNIAGVTVPTFDGIEFFPATWDLFATDWCIDDLIATLREAIELRCAGAVLEKQYAILAAELQSTTQRVNLFEKVKIPECDANIKKINIMLGDANTASVARSKIAKKKSAQATC